MSRFYDLSNEELQEILRFVNEEGAAMPSPDTVSRFQNIAFAFQGKCIKQVGALRQDNERLRRRLDRYTRTEQQAIEAGEFAEAGLDSVVVARALLYCLQQMKAYKLTKTKLVLIVYGMYASWLASKKTRLFVEHPVATEWGPQFWRVYKRVDTRERMTSDDWKALTELSPAVAAFTKNSAIKYADYSEEDIRKLYLKSQPYKKAKAEQNDGKWNKEINDTDIYLWATQKS